MTTTIHGLPDVRRALGGIVPALRRKIMLPILRRAAQRTVRDDARRNAPVLSPAAALKAPQRTPGLLKRSIVVRTSKRATRAGDVGVFVNVRPAKGAKYRTTRAVLGRRTRTKVRDSQRGTRLDPFYWRFLEFGTKHMSKRPFLAPAARRLDDALRLITAELGAEFRPDGGGLKSGGV